MKDIYYSVVSSWRNDHGTPALIGARFLDTLDQLKPLGPAMNNWVLLDTVNSAGVPLVAIEDITAFVEHNIDRDESGETYPNSGYFVRAYGGEVTPTRTGKDIVKVSVDAGSPSSNTLRFEIGNIGDPPDLPAISYPVFRGALEVLARNWPCPWAYARAFVIDLPPLVEATFPLVARERALPPPFEGAWIAYLSAPLAKGLRPPADLVRQTTPGGGLILSAALERLDPDDPDHARRSELLRAILQDRVGGWPSDPSQPARDGAY